MTTGSAKFLPTSEGFRSLIQPKRFNISRAVCVKNIIIVSAWWNKKMKAKKGNAFSFIQRYHWSMIRRAEQWRSFVAKLKYVYNVLFLKYSPLHASLCLKYKSVVCLTLCHRITGIACKFITKKEGVSIGLQHTTRDSMFLSAVAGIFPPSSQSSK